MRKEISISLCLLLIIIILIGGCIQQNIISNPIHSTPAPSMPHLELNTSPNPTSENTNVSIIVKLLSSKGEPMPNELIYIDLTRETENRTIVNNMVSVNYNKIIEPYQIYTNSDGNAILYYNTPSLPSYQSCGNIEISVLWKNSTGAGSVSGPIPSNLIFYTTRPTYSIQSFGLNPIIYLSEENEAYTTTTIISRTEGGNLYNLGPINFAITQGNETNYLTAYTNCGGQASINFKPKSGFLVVKATYQNFSDTVNTTIPPSQIPSLPPEPYALIINANPNPATSGSNVTITAKLTQNGSPLPNQQITFYMISSTNIVGSTPTLSRAFSYTDSNGEATVVLYALRAGEDKIAAIWGDYSNTVTVTYQ